MNGVLKFEYHIVFVIKEWLIGTSFILNTKDKMAA